MSYRSAQVVTRAIYSLGGVAFGWLAWRLIESAHPWFAGAALALAIINVVFAGAT